LSRSSHLDNLVKGNIHLPASIVNTPSQASTSTFSSQRDKLASLLPKLASNLNSSARPAHLRTPARAIFELLGWLNYPSNYQYVWSAAELQRRMINGSWSAVMYSALSGVTDSGP